MKDVKQYKIKRIEGEKFTEEKDIVVTEYHFTIFINGEELVTLLCTPKSLEYLAVGYIYSENIINSFSDIEKICIDEQKGIAHIFLKKLLKNKRKIIPSCREKRSFSINARNIMKLMMEFNESSKLFLDTGGVHSCAIADCSDIIMFEEDIGRHNALDKVVGKAIIKNIKLTDKLVLTSGRISSEILTKIVKNEIPIIVSRSAPTSLAIDMARKMNITLIGFVRGEKMNIYSNFPSINF